MLLHLALSAFIDPRSPEPLASELRKLSSGVSPGATEHAPLSPRIELNDAPIMELHSTRVQGSTCKHAAIPTGLSRRCDWVVMNETSAGLTKYRSPPRCVSGPKFPRNFATPCPTHQLPGLSSCPCAWAKLRRPSWPSGCSHDSTSLLCSSLRAGISPCLCSVHAVEIQLTATANTMTTLRSSSSAGLSTWHIYSMSHARATA